MVVVGARVVVGRRRGARVVVVGARVVVGRRLGARVVVGASTT